ncbi:lysozyme [Gandjariella thermophila]|uniref:Lysozyme n=1 Tax=Gandjariella thermophila TaxID=1931992 RepID=A0A4D4JCG7_9PSEU|nr:lysozyme [Gandjariella thermophila]GDY32136.1 lysozyme [Gandjariella thermophila]
MRLMLGARWRLVPAAAGLLTSALLCGLAGTPGAAATPAGVPAEPGITHPDADHAGSEIVKHEGREPGSGVLPNVVRTPGLDVSAYQGSVNWTSVVANGAKFAYVKATEGTGYTNPSFTQQYNGSYQAGLIRGAYHFALPDRSGGATQADYFVNHGGGWSRDGKTLPPMLDVEYNPYGAACYGLSQAAMRSWIQAFSDRVHARTSRYPTVYTSTTWWTQCTGNWSGLGSTNPLFIARYASSPGTLPAGWAFWTFWQYADSGVFPGDQDYFNGATDRLTALALG